MNQESSQDRLVVLAVVALLGVFAIVGLAGTIWLVHDHAEGASIAVVSTLTGGAMTGLAALLASTRSAPPVPVAQAYQQGANDTVTLMAAAAGGAAGPPPTPPAIAGAAVLGDHPQV